MCPVLILLHMLRNFFLIQLSNHLTYQLFVLARYFLPPRLPSICVVKFYQRLTLSLIHHRSLFSFSLWFWFPKCSSYSRVWGVTSINLTSCICCNLEGIVSWSSSGAWDTYTLLDVLCGMFDLLYIGLWYVWCSLIRMQLRFLEMIPPYVTLHRL